MTDEELTAIRERNERRKPQPGGFTYAAPTPHLDASDLPPDWSPPPSPQDDIDALLVEVDRLRCSEFIPATCPKCGSVAFWMSASGYTRCDSCGRDDSRPPY